MPRIDGLSLNSSQDEPLEIVPDCGGGKYQRVDAVKHSAMAGEERSGILSPGTALERRFENVSHLARNAAERGHREHVRRRDLQPIPEHSSHKQRSEEICAGAL